VTDAVTDAVADAVDSIRRRDLLKSLRKIGCATPKIG
jgi:hypothetical protein